MKTALLVGACGDSFCGAGEARHRFQQKGVERFSIAHYGFDPNISLFFREQTFVSEVKWLKPKNRIEYETLVALSGRASNAVSSWMPQMIEGSGLRAADVVPCQLHDIEDDGIAYRWYNAVLPEKPKAWAQAFLKRVGLSRFYLLNPISLQSTSREDHWPFWEQSIEWLLSCTDESYVLVGQHAIFQNFEHPRLLNISGCTDSVLDVFALADCASGLITTCNGLSYWSIMNSVPAVVTSHRNHERSKYFWNWLAHPPNRMVGYKQGVDVFSTLVRSMQDGAKNESRKW